MNRIFTYFLSRDGDREHESKLRQGYMSWFVLNFPETEFSGEDKVMWHLIKYANRLNISIKERMLSVFLDSEIKTLIVKKNIHVTGTEHLMFDDLAQLHNAVQITKKLLFECYDVLVTDDSDLDDFVASADAWMSEQLNRRLKELYATGFDMIANLTNGMIGADDALTHTVDNVTAIKEIYDKDKLEELSSECTSDNDEEGESFEFVTDTGLPTIDRDMQGACRTQLIGVEAPPGYGKTKFSVGVWAYRAMVFHKKNVAYFALEQTKAEIKAMLIARHIYQLTKEQVSSDIILKKKYLQDKKLTELVRTARIDLFDSGKYGKIFIQGSDKSLYLESFVDRFKFLDRLHGPFDLFIVDYMTLMEQEGGKFQKALADWQIAKKAYQKFKKFCSKYKKLGIAVNQLNAQGTKDSENDKAASTTSGAGGMETYRSTDYNIVISATESMKAQEKRRLSTPKTRNSKGYGSIVVETRLNICWWYQNIKNNNIAA